MPDVQKFTNKLQGARVLIVGGSSGIGYAVAEGCLEYGATVHIASSSPAKVSSAVDKLLASYPSASERLHGHTCNLGDAKTIESEVVALFEATGTLDHVISTAGDALSRSTTEASVEDMVQFGMVRYFAIQILARHAIKHLEPSYRSSITFTTGSSGEKPFKGSSARGGYPTAIFGLVRSFALDYAPIRVNGVSAGGTDTPLFQALGPSFVDMIKKMTSSERLAEPEEVAEAYLYLLKDSNCTGSVVRTDGGLLIK